MKADERALLRAVAGGESFREAVNRLGIPMNRGRYLAEKWGRKGWYEWGVVYDLGWLEALGHAAAFKKEA